MVLPFTFYVISALSFFSSAGVNSGAFPCRSGSDSLLRLTMTKSTIRIAMATTTAAETDPAMTAVSLLLPLLPLLLRETGTEAYVAPGVGTGVNAVTGTGGGVVGVVSPTAELPIESSGRLSLQGSAPIL